MRTTISIDDHLLLEAKRRAAERGQTLGELIEDHLREGFAHSQPRLRSPVKIPVYHGRSGVLPGIDVTSNASLLEAMEDGKLR